MKIRYLYPFILLLFGASPVFAQSPYFRVHEFGNEFPNLQIELIYEDNDGILWLGTSDGLLQYDGIHYQQFLKPDPSSNFVSAIFQSQSRDILVGYKDGSIQVLNKQKLKPFSPLPDTLQSAITGISEDQYGQIWVATYGQGLFCLSNNQFHQINIDQGLLGEDIYVLTKDLQGRMWIGTDGGINICKFENGKFIIESITKENGLLDEIVKEILRDQKGNMWIGMYDNGVCYYEVDKNQFIYPKDKFEDKIVNNLCLFEGKELWIGTLSNGLWRYSLEDELFRPIKMEGKILGSKVYDLHKDIEGNAWVLTNDHGLCHANRQFEFLNVDVGKPFKNIQVVLADSRNNLWIGTENGLFFTNNDPLENTGFKEILPNNNIVSLFEDEHQNIWIGTFGDGLYILDTKSKKTKRLDEQDGITNNSILSIAGMPGYVWLATIGGVTEIKIEQNVFENENLSIKNFNKESGLGTDFIYKIYIDSKHRVWFATAGKGVSVLENGKITNFSKATHYHKGQKSPIVEPLKSVYSITEDHQGHIWFSTAQKGIFEYDGQQFKHLTVKEGIRDLEITSLITDSKGNIVIVHSSGIDLLDPATHHLIYYDNDVGITDFEPGPNAVCTDKFNDIWIAGQYNLIKYTPLNEDLEIHPRTRIKSVSVFLEPIDFHTQTLFDHDQNNLVFDYTGIWYTDPETVKYRYQLEGYDLDWIFSADNKVTYSNLRPGKYTFKVMSTENDAFSDEPISSYSFQIKLPYWQNWWFILLVLIFAGLLFYFYQRQRDKRLQRVNLLEKEKATSQLEAIKAQMNPHFLFNSFNTLITIIEESPGLAVKYVEHLSDYYRSILQYRDKEIIELSEEIELIKSFNFLLKKRFGDNFNIDINVNGESCFIAPLTLQMLVENAVKHNVISKSKPLLVTIGLEKGYITVVNNLQEKINSKKSTEFGLQSIQKRYELITDKKVEIEKTENYFKVKIPVIK